MQAWHWLNANRSVSNGRGFLKSSSVSDLEQPLLPRVTRCPSGGPRQSGLSRAELGTTPFVGNAHPKKSRWPIQTPSKTVLDGLGWALGAHPSPSKSPSIPIQNAFGWGVRGAVTISRGRREGGDGRAAASPRRHTARRQTSPHGRGGATGGRWHRYVGAAGATGNRHRGRFSGSAGAPPVGPPAVLSTIGCHASRWGPAAVWRVASGCPMGARARDKDGRASPPVHPFQTRGGPIRASRRCRGSKRARREDSRPHRAPAGATHRREVDAGNAGGALRTPKTLSPPKCRTARVRASRPDQIQTTFFFSAAASVRTHPCNSGNGPVWRGGSRICQSTAQPQLTPANGAGCGPSVCDDARCAAPEGRHRPDCPRTAVTHPRRRESASIEWAHGRRRAGQHTGNVRRWRRTVSGSGLLAVRAADERARGSNEIWRDSHTTCHDHSSSVLQLVNLI